MSIHEVRQMTTCLDADYCRRRLDEGCKGFHESLLRSYHTVAEIRRYLVHEVPHLIIIELIDEMERK